MWSFPKMLGALALACAVLVAWGAAAEDWGGPMPVAQPREPKNAYERLYARVDPYANCCWSRECCQPISEEEIEPVPGSSTRTGPGKYRIKASGEIREAKWSPDGRYHRCACEGADKEWERLPTSYTYCLFVPAPGS
ncbi:MAG TPA: hypothetical protein VM434_20340 [Beijerinckiaceae bacterium]|nr:hypothetical protein [Beijerinckiaceae bacterium]